MPHYYFTEFYVENIRCIKAKRFYYEKNGGQNPLSLQNSRDDDTNEY